MPRPRGSIRVSPDAGALADATADWVAASVREAVAARAACSMALAGGQTPVGTYQVLAGRHTDSVPWERVLFLLGDERMVPPDHEASNYAMARRELLDPLGIPEASVIRVPTEIGSAAEAAVEYEEHLRAALGRSGPPALDLVLLGLGEDGHTASLMPGSVALQEKDRLVTWCRAREAEYDRVTLTLPALNAARKVAFLVSGTRKATVLRRVLEESPGADLLPAQRIRPHHGVVHWFVDAQAARELPPLEPENS